MSKRKSDAQAQGQRLSDPSTASTANKSNLIQDLNALDHDAFQNRFFNDVNMNEYEHDRALWTFKPYFARNLPSDLLQLCFKLIEVTSRHDYEPSSFGWHPTRKKREMREAEMRYLEVKDMRGSGWGGFISFMFTHDSTPAVPVLYLYEIHLMKVAQGKGLGGFLMRTVERVAREAGVEKVMLTCFLSNENALAFYRNLGFEVDTCSPENRRMRNKIVKTDYVIMSKVVSGREGGGAEVAAQTVSAGGNSLVNASTASQPTLLKAAAASYTSSPIIFAHPLSPSMREKLKGWENMSEGERIAVWRSMATELEQCVVKSDVAPQSSVATMKKVKDLESKLKEEMDISQGASEFNDRMKRKYDAHLDEYRDICQDASEFNDRMKRKYDALLDEYKDIVNRAAGKLVDSGNRVIELQREVGDAEEARQAAEADRDDAEAERDEAIEARETVETDRDYWRSLSASRMLKLVDREVEVAELREELEEARSTPRVVQNFYME